MRIAISGYGKMGHEVERLALAQGHEIVAIVDNGHDWHDQLKALRTAEVAIEFSEPSQAYLNISRCFDLHLPVVVGTTGWYDLLPAVKERCLKEGQSLFYAPNFSIGMNMMFRLNKQLAQFAEQYGYTMSLAETHHIHKLDKPSGTAAKLANDIIAVNGNYERWSIEAPSDAHTLPIEVTREGEVFGIHSVTALSTADRLTVTHEAFSREGLAQGALAAARFLIGKRGVFTMEDILF